VSGTQGRTEIAGIGRGARRVRGAKPFASAIAADARSYGFRATVSEVRCACGCGGVFEVPTGDRAGRRCFSGTLLFPELTRGA
jgi:hypothetical protein